MTYALGWMGDALRGANQNVVEEGDWLNRGHGDFGTPKGILLHHTACSPGTADDPSLSVVINGRPDLAGPLCNLLLARSGTWHLIAAGRAYHAGAGVWQGVTMGNSELIGLEIENSGMPDDPYPKVQMDAAIRGCSGFLKHIGAPVIMIAGHREYCRPVGRKIDPSFSCDDFRANVAQFMTG